MKCFSGTFADRRDLDKIPEAIRSGNARFTQALLFDLDSVLEMPLRSISKDVARSYRSEVRIQRM